MTEQPTTPPGSLGPAGQLPTDPPILALSKIHSDVVDASQSIIDSIWQCINDAATVTDSVESDIRSSIKRCIEQVEADYTSAGDLISADVMAKIGFIVSQVDSLPIDEITPDEIRQRASAIPWAGGPLPPWPAPGMPYIPVTAPRVVEVPVSGRPIGTIENPGMQQPLPTALLPFVRTAPGVATGTIGPAMPSGPSQGAQTRQSSFAQQQSASGRGRPSGPTAASTQPTTGAGTDTGRGVTLSTVPVGPGPAGTTYTAYSPFGSATQPTDGAGAGGGPGQPPPAYPPPAPPSNRDAPAEVHPGSVPPYTRPEGGSPTAGAGTAPIGAAPCPPVTVVIQCEPGAIARQLPAEGAAPEAPGPGPQFIKSDIELDRSAPVPPGMKPAGAGAGAGVKPSPEVDGVSLVGRQPHDLTLDKLPKGAAPTPWDKLFSADVVKLLAQLMTPEGCKALTDFDATARMAVDTSAAAWWAYRPDGSLDTNTLIGGAVGALPGWMQPVAQVMVGLLVGQFRTAWSAAAQVAGCTSPLFPAIAGMRSLVGFVEHWIGAPFPEAMNHLDQIAGQICPTGIPSVAEADRAWYVGAIDDASWRCWVRANGVRDDLQRIVRTAGEPRPSPDQMYAYTLRKGIPTDQSLDYLKWAGVSEWQTWDAIVELARYVPGPGDLVRFMVRDVFDESVVEKYQYDEEFNSKFSGRAVEWARSQGMTAEQFKYYWRAHWQLPSPGQGYTMIHRLRKGVVPDELVTDEATIAQLLEVNDYPKYWRDRLIAISYHPITRIDARRSYFIGSLNDDELVSAMMDLGYSERNARKMLNFWQLDRIEWLLNRPLSRAYMKGELSDSELSDWIATLNLAPKTLVLFAGRLDIQSKLVQRRGTLRAIKTRVVRGITDWIDAQQELIQMGYRAARSSQLAQAWDEERKARGKYPAANQLCRMYAKGIIDVGTYSEALLRLGYDAVDVQRIMALGCNTKGEGAVPLPAGMGPKGALPVPPGPPKKAGDARAAQAAVARAARERNALSKAEESVQKRLTQTNMALVKAFGGSPTDYQAVVRSMFDVLRTDKCYTRDGASSLVKELVGDLAKRRRRDWQTIAEGYLSQMTPRPCPPPDNTAVPKAAEELAQPE